MEESELDIKINVLLVGVDTGENTDFDKSMEELKCLAEACDKRVTGIITQRLEHINKALYIGSGKVLEVKEYARFCEAEEIIFDDALSPSQIRNLVKELDYPVMDRTNLILDIFALRAKTKEAKLQVETAKLQYMLPRLVGLHDSLGRQSGTSGAMSNKGTGEKKLELDRRKIEKRISELNKELAFIAGNRDTQRKKRENSGIPKVALVGYTNAGKSTILNKMVERYSDTPQKVVLQKDMLFATLETSVRFIDPGNKKPFFLSDTVGFIHKLPHGLIKAFRSTLEEVRDADLLIHVVDFSDDSYRQQMKVTKETLEKLDAGGIPQIICFNKSDLCDAEPLPKVLNNHIYMAAGAEVGIEKLVELIQAAVYQDCIDCEFFIPYDKGNITSYLMENATVLEKEYEEEGVRLKVNCKRMDYEKYLMYTV